MNEVTSEGGRPHGGHAQKMADYLPHYLSRLMNVMNLQLMESLRPQGVTIRQFRVLQMLDARGEATISEISTDIVIEQPVVSRIIDQLERSGLATRKKRANNGRLVDVSLTELGTETYRQLFIHAQRIDADAMSALSTEEFEMLEVLLQRIFEHVTRPHEPWKQPPVAVSQPD